MFFSSKKSEAKKSARISYSLLYYYTCIILYDISVMGGVTILSWGDIFFMGGVKFFSWGMKFLSWVMRIRKMRGDKKNRLKLRRHKQKVKTKNPDFVQNGFVKVGTVCEFFVKKSIDKKKAAECPAAQNRIKEVKNTSHVFYHAKKNPCKKSTARIERVCFSSITKQR